MNKEQLYAVEYTFTNGYRCACCMKTNNRFEILNKESVNKILEDLWENDINSKNDFSEYYKIMVYDIEQIRQDNIIQLKKLISSYEDKHSAEELEPDFENYKPVAYFIKDWHQSRKYQYTYTHLVIKKIDEEEKQKFNSNSDLSWGLFKKKLDLELLFERRTAKINELIEAEKIVSSLKEAIKGTNLIIEEIEESISRMEK